LPSFKAGVLVDLKWDVPALLHICENIKASQRQYGLPIVLEETHIGLNEKAHIIGNTIEDKKIRGICDLALGYVRCHVDMLVNKPMIID
jgi:hypothetical protein